MNDCLLGAYSVPERRKRQLADLGDCVLSLMLPTARLRLVLLVTFCVSRSLVDDAKCIVVTRVCVSVCLSAAACPHYSTDPDVT